MQKNTNPKIIYQRGFNSVHDYIKRIIEDIAVSISKNIDNQCNLKYVAGAQIDIDKKNICRVIMSIHLLFSPIIPTSGGCKIQLISDEKNLRHANI